MYDDGVADRKLALVCLFGPREQTKACGEVDELFQLAQTEDAAEYFVASDKLLRSPFGPERGCPVSFDGATTNQAYEAMYRSFY